MKKNIIIIIGCILCLFTRCTKNKELIDNSKGFVLSSDIKRTLVDSVYFRSSRIIPLETNDNSLLRKITRICSDENKLFIFDKSLNKMVIFMIDGKYLTDIHKIGNGPSEYMDLMDFCLDVDRKQILLLCSRPYKIMKFNYLGEFIEEKAISDLYFNIISNSNLVYCNKLEINTTNQDDFELTCMDSDLQLMHNYLPMRDHITTTIVFPGSKLTSTLNDYYTRRFDNVIYQITKGELKKKYVIDFKKNALPDALLKQQTKDDFAKMASGKEYVYSITEVSESENYLMFNSNIAIFVLDKKTETLEGYKTIQNSEIQISSNSYFSIGNNSQMIASVINPLHLSSIKEDAKNVPNFDNYELLKLAEKVDEEDNPILLLYEFK